MAVNHGADLHKLSTQLNIDRSDIKDFSSNINPLGCSKKALDYVKENLELVSIYPDPEYSDLKDAIAGYCKCSKNSIVLGCGATELISTYIGSTKPENAVLTVPIYSEFEKELNKNNVKIHKFHCETVKIENDEYSVRFNTEKLIDFINETKSELLVICNPNNPSGFAFSNEEIEKIMENTDCNVMIDETYIEFTDTDVYSSAHLVDKYDNMFVIRGTSKFFSTPGIRLGYALTSNRFVKKAISENLDLWNINIIAQELGRIMFRDELHIKTSQKLIAEEREYIYRELNKIEGICAFRSMANFVLARIDSQNINAEKLRNYLMAKGMIIRNCDSFEGLDKNYFRVCILEHQDNRRLLKYINDFFCNKCI